MDRFQFIFRNVYPWVVLIHAGLFVVFWLSNGLFSAVTNTYIGQVLGAGRDYVSICLWAAGAVGAWSLARFAAARMGWNFAFAVPAAWLYAVLSLVFIVFFYASFVILFRLSSVQVVRLGQFVQYFRAALDPLLLLAAAGLIGWSLRALKPANLWPLAGGTLLLALLWIIPLFVLPGSVVRGELPKKPQIIAHRGASFLAPENTLASARRAAELGVYGLETDVRISLDGKPFLMHDDTLKRTTDVDTIFPGRGKQRAENFTLDEIRRLNAGKWFVEQDPYGTIARGSTSPAQVEAYRSQQVPTLAEELQIVREQKLIFIFDLKQPPQNQPYAQSFFEVTLGQLKEANIDAQIWFLADPDDLPDLRRIAPAMILAYSTDYTNPPDTDALQAAGYRVVNAEYGLSPEWISAYRQAGLWVNLWTVDEPWQFSRLWLMGVDSTTTSNAGEMAALERPVWVLAYETYVWLWAAAGVLGMGILVGLARFFR